MIKNEPIIFQVRNPNEYEARLKIPYRKDLRVESPEKRLFVCFDIKANTEWHKNIIPDEFNIRLAAKQSMAILIKPSNDKYFAGWGRWFNWHKNLWCKFLTAVLFDPDYAHLKSETEIGNDFRARQYANCSNLTLAPNEDLDGEFEEIGENFRSKQYDFCESLINRPKELMPIISKEIGENFRYEQYRCAGFVCDFINAEQKNDEFFLEMLFKNNPRIFKNIPDDLKTEIMCKIAIEKDRGNFQYVPKDFMTTKMCKTVVEDNIYFLKYVPENLRTEEMQKKISDTGGIRKSHILSQDEIDALLTA
jgi:hypothetical protein